MADLVQTALEALHSARQVVVIGVVVVPPDVSRDRAVGFGSERERARARCVGHEPVRERKPDVADRSRRWVLDDFFKGQTARVRDSGEH